MVHFYMIATSEVHFLAELFIRSLPHQDFLMTICGEGNNFLKRHAEIIPLPPQLPNMPHWYSGLGCIKPKGDITVLVDADLLVLTTNNLKFTNAISGVLAYASPKIDWKKLSISKLDYKHSIEKTPCPFYVNLGLVVMPNQHVEEISARLVYFLKHVEEIYPNHYHRPQLAMCLALQGLPVEPLPLSWNMPDLYDLSPKEVYIAHLLKTKSIVGSWESLKHFVQLPHENGLMKKIQDKLKFILKTRY